MTAQEIEEDAVIRYLAESCAASGVPLTVTDRDTLLAVAAMLRG